MDEPKDALVAAPKAGRGMKVALILSLTLNLLILGVMCGAMLAHGGPGGPGGIRDIGFGPYTEALTGEDRKALREAFIKAAPDFRAGREEMRADVARLAAAIRAEPYDRAAVEAVMASQAARIEDRLQLGRGLILDRLDAMGPEARAALAGRIETMRMKRRD